MTSLKRILYVEDEPDIQELVKIALCELDDFELLVCNSGFDAIKKVVSFSPDLFLLDVMMPGINGPDTLKALKTIPGLATIPTIFMTAKVQIDEIDELKRMGALDVIAKPFNPITLANEIKKIYNHHSDT